MLHAQTPPCGPIRMWHTDCSLYCEHVWWLQEPHDTGRCSTQMRRTGVNADFLSRRDHLSFPPQHFADKHVRSLPFSGSLLLPAP